MDKFEFPKGDQETPCPAPNGVHELAIILDSCQDGIPYLELAPGGTTKCVSENGLPQFLDD